MKYPKNWTLSEVKFAIQMHRSSEWIAEISREMNKPWREVKQVVEIDIEPEISSIRAPFVDPDFDRVDVEAALGCSSIRIQGM